MSAPSHPPVPVQLHADGPVRRLVLNRPERLNAIDITLARAFESHCQALLTDPTVRAVIIESEGPCFGVGGDLEAFSTAGDNAGLVAAELIEVMHRAVLALAQMNAPVIASVHGNVAGGSFSLALACDLILAADDARFNLAYGKVGASCDVGASWHLPRRVGLTRAMEIALLSPTIAAPEALAMGLVNRVVPAAERRSQALALAHTLASGPTLAFGRLKRLLRTSFESPLDKQLDDERDGFVASTATQDFRTAMNAFFARQAPHFSGN